MTDDNANLLAEFARDPARGDALLAPIVRRHLGLVYSTALRRLGGDAHLAQDVAQVVFADLARKAASLQHHRVLEGWLYTSTLYAAAKLVRSEQRRRRREQEAQLMQELTRDDDTAAIDWTRTQPVLDEAMRELKSDDRDAILLRFFGGLGFAELGTRLRITESGARMRVERALTKLQAHLARRGIASTSAALAVALGTQAIAAPPLGLAAAVTGSALAGATGASGAFAALQLFAMTKMQIGIAAAVIATGAVTVGLQRQERAQIAAELATTPDARNEIVALREETVRLAQIASEFQARPQAAAELERLRAEAATLTAQLVQPPSLPAAQNPRRDLARFPTTRTAPRVPGAFEISEVDQLPQAVARSAPVYPFELKRSAIPGEAIVSFVVGEDGAVSDLAVLDQTHPDFAASAQDAVARWQFRPALKDGKPVKSRMQMPIVFFVQEGNWF